MTPHLRLTVLGSGTSSGVPAIGCDCRVCRSGNPKNKRLRSSCLIEARGQSLLIDTSPDLRQQALTHNIRRVDAVLYTHIHADHVHGIDELRMYNTYQKSEIPVYGHEGTINHLVKHFSYIFRPSTSYPSITPRLSPHIVEGLFDCLGVPVQMVPCQHGPYMTYNYRVGSLAWLTDTNGLPESSYGLLEGLDVLFVDALRIQPHPTHFHLEEALKFAQRVGARRTYLIHLTHNFDHDEFNKTLPSGVELAYDGLAVTGKFLRGTDENRRSEGSKGS